MGANASTPGSGEDDTAGNGARSSSTKNTGPDDLYELLGTEPTATADEIRKACAKDANSRYGVLLLIPEPFCSFRREALKWHPDKNAGSEEAAKRFIKIQAAYDVLSDDQERAYYDSHRGDIGEDDLESESDLRAKAARASASKQSVRITSRQLTRFFDPSLWSADFSDGANGFYSIYRALFDTISESELYATAPAGEPALSSTPLKYPSFGNSYMQYDAPDATLKSFYTAYMSFASRRPFNEVDKYRLQEAPDRRVKRLMEKDNKRARDEARKEYNDSVRSLAAFLKKRDPRFLNSTSSDPLRVKQLERQRLQAQLREAAFEAAKKREESARAYQEQDWQKIRTEDSEDEEDDSEDEGNGHDGETAEQLEDGHAEDEAEENEDMQDWFCPACEKDFASQGAWDNHERSKKHLKNMEKLKREMQDEEEELGLSHEAVEQIDLKGDVDEDILFSTMSKKDRKKAKRRFGTDFGEPPEADGKGGREEPTTAAEEQAGLENDTTAQEEEGRTEGGTLTPAVEEQFEQPAMPELSKKDKRRAKEAAKKASGTSTPVETCNVCQTSFTSRTKLFAHVKESGHAAAVAVSENGRGTKKGKKR